MSQLERDVQRGCYQVYFTGDKQQPTSRDLIIYRGDKSYLISITTPRFLKELRTYNLQLDPLIQLDDNYLVMDKLPSVEELCKALSQIPTEELKPFLTEQKTS